MRNLRSQAMNCNAIDCKRTIPDNVLFCHLHWWAVPNDLKRSLLRQKDASKKKLLLRTAVGTIAYKEGKEMPEK